MDEDSILSRGADNKSTVVPPKWDATKRFRVAIYVNLLKPNNTFFYLSFVSFNDILQNRVSFEY